MKNFETLAASAAIVDMYEAGEQAWMAEAEFAEFYEILINCYLRMGRKAPTRSEAVKAWAEAEA